MRQIAKLSSLSVISVLLILVACGTSNNNVGTVPDDGGSGGIPPSSNGTSIVTSGLPGSGGIAAASGGVTGSGGVSRTASSTSGSGGTTGTAGSSPAFGMACTTNDDCPSGSTCCNGSDESCDGTRLPTGDGTNPGEFVVSSDGLTVTDTITGLVWQRDGSGARAGCSGDASGSPTATSNLTFTCIWSEAQAYCASLTIGGISTWRLPAVKELATIRDPIETNPSIDQTTFPNTPSFGFWTSTVTASFLADAAADTNWSFDFSVGGPGPTGYAFNDLRVRCVSDSRCYPNSRFVVLSGGLVQDTLTGLVWQQQASTTDMTWADAKTYCSSAGSGLRLPTVRELLSIMDFTVAWPGPTIDQTAFPSTSTDYRYWTSSLLAGSSDAASFVSFGDGTVDVGLLDLFLSVRCVR